MFVILRKISAFCSYMQTLSQKKCYLEVFMEQLSVRPYNNYGSRIAPLKLFYEKILCLVLDVLL